VVIEALQAISVQVHKNQCRNPRDSMIPLTIRFTEINLI